MSKTDVSFSTLFEKLRLKHTTDNKQKLSVTRTVISMTKNVRIVSESQYIKT